MLASRPGTRALRAGRVSIPGHVYLVTTTVKGRVPLFRDWHVARRVCRIAASHLDGSRFLAWVLMPDHFHGLLKLGDEADLSGAMRSFKGRSALSVNRQLGGTGSVWQSTFHDHAVRREEGLAVMARYIVENPVRAGLVRTLGEYPYWNTDWEL